MSWLYTALVGGSDSGSTGPSQSPASLETPSDPPPSYPGPNPPGPAPPARAHRLPPPPPLNLPTLNDLRQKRLILASASPRRKHLLSLLGLDPVVIPSHFPETLSKSHLTPFEYVLTTATGKCTSVYTRSLDSPRGDPALVLAADTVVVTHAGSILEKPRSEAEHVEMLCALRDGPPHKVYTAVVVMAPLKSSVHPGYARESCVEETVVAFDPLVTDELVLAYVRTREGADKAGGYAIQGAGAMLIKKIEGSYDNVVGLPLRSTLKIIEKVMSRDEEMEEGEEEATEEEEEE